MWSNQAPDSITIPPGAGPGQRRLIIDNTGITIYDATDTIVSRLSATASYFVVKLIQGISDIVGRSPANVFLREFVSIVAGAPAGDTPGHLNLNSSPTYNTSGNYAELGAGDGIGVFFIRDPNAPANATKTMFELNHITRNTLDRLIRWGNRAQATRLLEITQQATTDGIDRYQFGASTVGAVYNEEFNIGAVSIANGGTNPVATVPIPLTVNATNKDYAGSQMDLTTGIWTCPEDGWYNVTHQVAYTGGVAGSRVGLYVLRNANTNANPFLVNESTDQSARGRFSVSGTRFVFQGDTLKFLAIQVTGAPQTIATGDLSFISISRKIGS